MIDSKPPPADPEEATRQAIDDLQVRLDASADQIEVSAAENVTWSDGSLGCPEPGKVYTQSLVPGLRVSLTFEGREYAYHASDGGALFYCASPGANWSTDS